MNIGIITCWKPDDNYGTQIQCFALQTYLRSKGHNAYLIRYMRNNDLVRIPLSQRKILNIINPVKIFRIAYVKLLVNKQKKISGQHDRNAPAFRDKYLNQSREYSGIDDLSADPPEADIYIVGSDQVWNINYRQINNLKAHYLCFGSKNTKRISYAASFGFGDDKLSKEYISVVKPLLEAFDGISVRESTGLSICKKIGETRAVQVCDPTFLIEPKEYLDFFKDEKIEIPSEDYIFVYNLSATSNLNIHEIKEWANNKGLKVLYVTGHGREETEDTVYPTIPEWVYYIAHSQYVITNSFHGSVFALLFHKPTAIYPVTGSSFGNPNSRFQTLINLVDTDLMVGNNMNFCEKFEKDIDWIKFEENKSKLVHSGKEFLDIFIK